MNRRKFLKFLGFGAPAAAVAAVVAPKLLAQVPQGESYEQFSARLGEWNNYHSESSPDIAEAIKNWKSHPYHHTHTLSEMASRRFVPIYGNTKRTFFTYNVGKMS